MTPSERAAAQRESLRALGPHLTPEMISGTTALCAAALDPGLLEGVEVRPDLVYGPHERHRLDVYTSGEGGGRPVLVYVHGGGFVVGQKSAPGSPFFGNLGGWAVRAGYVAVVINYRLAPESTWPGGAEDIARAIGWVVENAAAHGGDPERIFLAGQSAGAMHVADYLAQPGLHGPHGRALSGAVLVSCLYDVGRATDNPMHRAYWGEDRSRWAAMGSLDALVELDLPLLLTVSEFDEPEFLDHARRLAATWWERHRDYPPMHLLSGQNHLSPIYGIGTDTDVLGPLLERFIAAHARPGERGAR
ncbi:alpha/beta hydrolase [Microbacterium caowuchunii]|uniref:alpha/beta hydrolase n=1 Tax=Microbacterium caowuchunii TaxID=2614638 RepID=UPI001244B6BD|nr:alpha/beta hydrolase [Microbacterium caowuchunii]QEW01128.1 alpha/beta hydrolase [Microbacterium caowuchunii]